MVEPWSASIGDPGRERTETINANHMNMCRFTGIDDPGYVKVGSEIQERIDVLQEIRQGKLWRCLSNCVRLI